MENTMTREATSKTDAEYESLVDQHLAAIKLMQQEMDDDQYEIETLRKETDVILANIMQTLKAA